MCRRLLRMGLIERGKYVMSDFYIRKFDYPIYYQLHALRHHGQIKGIAVFKWYWYGLRVDRLYQPTQVRTSRQQGWRGVFYDAMLAWHALDKATQLYYYRLNYPPRLYGVHRYLRLYLREHQKMITYWGPLSRNGTDNSTPETFFASQYFNGVQRVRNLSDYPGNPEYGATIYHQGLKQYMGFFEDAGWSLLAPSSAPGNYLTQAQVMALISLGVQ